MACECKLLYLIDSLLVEGSGGGVQFRRAHSLVMEGSGRGVQVRRAHNLVMEGSGRGVPVRRAHNLDVEGSGRSVQFWRAHSLVVCMLWAYLWVGWGGGEEGRCGVRWAHVLGVEGGGEGAPVKEEACDGVDVFQVHVNDSSGVWGMG